MGDTSFNSNRINNRSFYTGWSSMSKLIKEKYVEKPTRSTFLLTELGKKLFFILRKNKSCSEESRSVENRNNVNFNKKIKTTEYDFNFREKDSNLVILIDHREHKDENDKKNL